MFACFAFWYDSQLPCIISTSHPTIIIDQMTSRCSQYLQFWFVAFSLHLLLYSPFQLWSFLSRYKSARLNLIQVFTCLYIIVLADSLTSMIRVTINLPSTHHIAIIIASYSLISCTACCWCSSVKLINYRVGIVPMRRKSNRLEGKAWSLPTSISRPSLLPCLLHVCWSDWL